MRPATMGKNRLILQRIEGRKRNTLATLDPSELIDASQSEGARKGHMLRLMLKEDRKHQTTREKLAGAWASISPIKKTADLLLNTRRSWAPEGLRAVFASSSNWSATIESAQLTIIRGGSICVKGLCSPWLSAKDFPGIAWSTVEVRYGEDPSCVESLDGLRNDSARDLAEWINSAALVATRKVIGDLLAEHQQHLIQWANEILPRALRFTAAKGSLDDRFVAEVMSLIPSAAIIEWLRFPQAESAITELAEDTADAIRLVGNLDSEVAQLRDLFESIERSDDVIQGFRAWLKGLDVRASRFFSENHNLGSSFLHEERAAFDLEAMAANARAVLDGHEQLGITLPQADLALIQAASAPENQISQVRERLIGVAVASAKPTIKKALGSALTDEQMRAVVSNPMRQRIIAAAGSGKTSVVVAKVVHCLESAQVTSDRILVLAFNKGAAGELEKRIASALSRLGKPNDNIRVATFHKFGIDVIGEATGKKPRLAPEIEQGRDGTFLTACVSSLLSRDRSFREKVARFEAAFSEPLFSSDGSNDEPTGRFRTNSGNFVRSREEVRIANLLFFHGVSFKYEEPYPFDTADAKHSQYIPDFYYPDAKIWHEHFAIDEKGTSPFGKKYLDSVEWKRGIHGSNGTALFETTSAGLSSGGDVERLYSMLKATNSLEKNQSTLTTDGPQISADLARVLRALISQAKSVSWCPRDFLTRSEKAGKDAYRTRLLLEIFEAVYAEWNRRLLESNQVDFDDMLADAAKHLECREDLRSFDLVIVDEFQDVSASRARILAALTKRTSCKLSVVGDDWQSIYRFAGADAGFLADFSKLFGECETNFLTKSFRCKQDVCDVASAFVSKNPAQISKSVSGRPVRPRGTMECVLLEKDASVSAAVSDVVSWHANNGLWGSGEPIKDILVLTRYQATAEPLRHLSGAKWPFGFSCRTMHSAKGLEADVVIILDLQDGSFPSRKQSDPVLEIALRSSDAFPFSEERRLMYVALTRAKEKLILLAKKDGLSAFVREIVSSGALSPIDMNGEAVEFDPCPKCQTGLLVARRGRDGEIFKGCSNFPACRGRAAPQSTSGKRGKSNGSSRYSIDTSAL